MNRRILWVLVSALLAVAEVCAADAQPSASDPSPRAKNGGRNSLTLFDVPVKRVLWQSETGVTHGQELAATKAGHPCELSPSSAILLDFGVELHGSVTLTTPETKQQAQPLRVRVRLGESAMEAMAELKFKNAGNDHAIRDKVIELSPTGNTTFGPSGFRFVRIDNVTSNETVVLNKVHAVLGMQNVQTLGSFRCDNERLNQIWEVGAYTVKLCMQECLMDGIKRDRAPWLGDMAPEVCTINSVFGFNDVVTHSIDGMRKGTPMDKWMNGIPSYSMWWVFIQEEMWMHHGDRAYLEEQHAYLAALLNKLAGLVDANGQGKIDGWAFIDWPTSPNKKAVDAGMHALLVLTLESGGRMMSALKDEETARVWYHKLSVPSPGGKVELTPAEGPYQAGSAVAVSVKPDGKHLFSAWRGDLSGNKNPASIKMDGDKKIIVEFTLTTADYNLALDGTATQSSIGYKDAVAARAIDGNTPNTQR